MRASATTAAFLVWAASTLVGAAPSGRDECFESRSRELAGMVSCGDKAAIESCLSGAASSSVEELLKAELEACFLDAGCTVDEAPTEVFWTLRRCEIAPAELKRRHLGLVAARVTPAVAARTPEVLAILNARATSTESRPATCTTTSEIPTSACSTTSGKSTCSSVTATTTICAPNVICSADGLGQNVICMYAHNSLDIGGIIVAIGLAGATVVSIFGVCFSCCRERNTQKRLSKAAEAAAIAREAKNAAMVASKRPEPSARIPSSDRSAGQPLMPEGGITSNPFDESNQALR